MVLCCGVERALSGTECWNRINLCWCKVWLKSSSITYQLTNAELNLVVYLNLPVLI